MSADYFPTACLYRPNYVEWVERHKPYGTKANDRWRLVYVLATDNLFIRKHPSKKLEISSDMNWLWVDHGGMDWSEYTHAYCYERRKTNIYDHSGTPECPATGHSHNHSFIKIS
jgi:hypothetical protein